MRPSIIEGNLHRVFDTTELDVVYAVHEQLNLLVSINTNVVPNMDMLSQVNDNITLLQPILDNIDYILSIQDLANQAAIDLASVSSLVASIDTSVNLARDWATKLGSEVATTEGYSAKHYALQSAEYLNLITAIKANIDGIYTDVQSIVSQLHTLTVSYEEGSVSNVTYDNNTNNLHFVLKSGSNGKSAFEIASTNGFVGSEVDWLNSLHGSDGASVTGITSSKIGKVTTVNQYIDGVLANTFHISDGVGSGDMLASTYDTNGNGVVDNAEKVNGLTVETAVPTGAVFTDTVYDDTGVLKDTDIGISIQSYDVNTVIDSMYVHTDNNFTNTLKSKLDSLSNYTKPVSEPISYISGLDSALNNKVDKAAGKQLSTEDYSTTEKTKLSGIASGAQVNVPTDLSLGTATATVLPLNSSTGTDVNLPSATTSTAGLLSATDKTKLDGVAANANNYTLPTATSTVKGGVEIYSDTVQSVVVTAVTTTASRTYGVQLNSAGQAVVNIPWTDTDTVYTHPTTDGSLHVPATSTTNNGKVLMAGATAGSISWQTIPAGVTDHTLLSNIGTNTHAQIDTAMTRLANTSGTNTGDENVTTIKSKLGISTLSGSNTGDQTITLTGDVTGSGTGSFATALSNTGVLAGTYKSVTVDLKGRITSGTNPTTISGFGISDAYTKTEIDLVVGDINSALDTINGQVI